MSITNRQFTNPEARQGYWCAGTATTVETTGLATITVEGGDFADKIIGVQISPLGAEDQLLTYYFTIVYDSATNITEIDVVFQAVTFDTDDLVYAAGENLEFHYSFFVSTKDLPADTTTNDTIKQGY